MIRPALLAVSVFALLHSAEVGATHAQRLALTAAALALYWVGMPNPSETVYWMVGSTDNLTGLALSLLLLAGLLRCQARVTPSGLAIGGGLSMLAVLIPGFHELFGLLLCIVLAGGTLKMWLARQDLRRWLWAACLAAALVGFLVVYVAPGNAVRRASFPLTGNVGQTLYLTVKQVTLYVIPWILDLRLLTGTALLLMLAPRPLIGRQQSCSNMNVVIVGLTWVTAFMIGFPAAAWATGIYMDYRTVNGIYLVFLTGWFWIIVMLVRQFAEREERLMVATPLMRHMVVALFAAAMLLTGNTWKALQDLPNAAPTYSKAMHERWRVLEAAHAGGEQDAVVEPLQKERPQSFIARNYFELREDPEHWENWCLAHAYGLRTVRLAGKADESR
jgi:hypothetical protein